MKAFSRIAKGVSLAMTGTMLWAFGGGCLPDNWLVDKAGEITNGLVISAINLLIAPTGLAI